MIQALYRHSAHGVVGAWYGEIELKKIEEGNGDDAMVRRSSKENDDDDAAASSNTFLFGEWGSGGSADPVRKGWQEDKEREEI